MRRHVLVHESAECNVWLIEWPPGHGLDWHDHGGSFATITVLEGVLTNSCHEVWRDVVDATQQDLVVAETEYVPGGRFHVGRHAVHRIVNNEGVTAVSLHEYRPPLLMEYSEDLEIS